MVIYQVLRVLLIPVLMLALGAMVVGAQDTLDLGAEPSYGAVTLQGDFTPDPYIATMTSGGAVDVSQLDLGVDCRGFAATRPDFRINLEGSLPSLRFFFVSEGDATLIINDPNGDWLCNDDAVDRTPVIEVFDPQVGIYDIWIGSYSASDFLSGYLMVTQTDSMPGAVESDLLSLAIGRSSSAAPLVTEFGDTLDPESAPTFGAVDLEPGFRPDPYTLEALPGGSVDVRALDIGRGECVGVAAVAPDFSLNLIEDFPLLRLFFIGEEDTTLIVRGPFGEWYCNDDSPDTVHPLVDIDNAFAGEYDVWIGNINPNGLTRGLLYITELTSNSPETVR
jgi:hypothetical protein